MVNGLIVYSKRKKMKKVKKILKILGVGILILMSTASAAHCLSISPTRIEVSVSRSEGYNNVLTVKNMEKVDINVSLRAEDWFKTSDGLKKEKAPKFNWLTLEPMEFELKDGETKNVNIKVNIPQNANGELNGMIFVEGRPQEVKEGSMTINTSVGIPIYVMIKGTEIFKAQVEDLSIVKTAPLELSVRIKNSGNAHIRPSGTIEIKRQKEVMISLPLNEYNYPILPNSSRTLEIKSSGRLEEGEYTADIKMGFRDREVKKRVMLKVK
jgi:P pilus assembly chaperone PapD